MLDWTDAVYTETRYPGDFGMLPEGKPSTQVANELYEFAENVYNNTVKLFIGE